MAALKASLIALALASPATPPAHQIRDWSGEIAEASARFGIPTGWIRQVMRVESNGRTMLDGHPIVSSAGAMGLMQLMPATWSELRAKLGLGLDPFDPRDNILAGTFYLRLMYDRFGYPGLFAAYHAGPARYAASLTSGRPLPAATRAYVAQVATEPSSQVIGGRAATGPPVGLFAVAPVDDRPPATAALFNRSGSLFVKLGGINR